MASYDRLSALDRSFLDLEDGSHHMHVAGAFILEGGPLRGEDGGIDIDRIRAYIESRLHTIPRYRQRIAWIPVENHPVWVDDERFNIDYHVRHTCLPPPGDDRQLKRLCGRIVSQQLDRGKPLWEIWIVEGLEHDQVAMISKTHHCMIDGVSAGDLLQALLSARPEKAFQPAPEFRPRAMPSRGELLGGSLLRTIGTPVGLASGALRLATNPGAALEQGRELMGGLSETLSVLRSASSTPLNHQIGPHRRFDWLALDIEEIKAIKNVLGGTVNDVVLAIVTGAVRRFLHARGMTAQQLRELDFRAFCPVSTRSESERSALGNRVSSMITTLPVGEKDPARRLATVSKRMGDLKKSKQALGAEALTSVSEWIAPTLVSMAARLAYRNRTSNVVVTNVPGPQIPLYLLGARMIETYPMVPLFTNQALGIALFSYAGGLYWGFNADWDLIPDLHDFVVDIDTAFHELAEAAAAG